MGGRLGTILILAGGTLAILIIAVLLISAGASVNYFLRRFSAEPPPPAEGSELTNPDGSGTTNGPLTYPAGKKPEDISDCLDEWMKNERSESPLVGKGKTFASNGQANNVNPGLMLAIGRQETELGLTGIAPSTKNFYGVTDTNGNFKTFSSWEDSISYMARYLWDGYLGPKYNLKTIEEIGHVWAPVGATNDPNGLNRHWVGNVKKFFNSVAQKCGLGNDLGGESPAGEVFKIYLHWSAMPYSYLAPNYTYSIDKDGNVHTMNGNAHTENRNTESVGISVMAMENGTRSCYSDLRGTGCSTPVTQKQLDAMVNLAAKIAGEKGIPIDSQHILTHGEAGSLMDYPEEKVKELMKCGNTKACAKKLGLPNDNYGPYRGGTSERWEFINQENYLRQLIKNAATKGGDK